MARTASGKRRVSKSLSLEALLLRLLDAEQADRQARSLRYQLKAARFPIHRDLTGFDWSETPLDAARIQELAKGHYLETAHNLILIGGTRTGKTHLAIALGVAAIHHGKRIRFYNAVDLVNLLEREKAQGKAGNLAKQLTQIDAVILPSRGLQANHCWAVDELGYLPFPASGGALCRRANGPPDPLLFHLHPSHQPTLRKDIPHRHNQSQLRRMGHGLRRPKEDHRAPRPHHSPLRHSRNRK